MQFNDFDINSPVIRHIHSLNEEIKALKDENYNLTIKLNKINAEIERLRVIEQKYNKIKNFFPLKVALKIRKLLLKLIGRI